MAGAALGLYVLYAALAFGLRTLAHLRHTGSTGFQGTSGRQGSPEWAAGALFAAALASFLVAPVVGLAGLVEPVAALDGPGVRGIGLTLYDLGLVGTLLAQEAIGDSWRIGVDEAERTDLVTAGPCAVVRTIFAAMVPASLGLALVAPNPMAIAAFLTLLAALELQVRFVGEPYLARTHGERYLAYASRVGRFVPGAGKLKSKGDANGHAKGNTA